MSSLSLGRVPAIVGAAGAIGGLAGHVEGLTASRQVVVLLDPNVAAEPVIGGLAAAGIEALAIVLPPGEPKEAFVADAVAQARASGAGSVVCVGGGSTLDAGKLVANLAPGGDALEAYRLAATALPRERLPLICAPTTAGTGAEATAVSVLTSAEGIKYWFWGASLKPDLILHDPVLTTSLPAAVTACTGVDALVHAMEAATNLNASAANTMYAHRAIELAVAWLPVAVRQPERLEARAAMLEAATLAGIAIDNAGTAIAHNIAHALGSLGAATHGRAVAIGMCATLAWNVEADPQAYAGVARAMGLESAEDLPAAFEDFVRSLGVDLRLEGVTAAALARQMAEPENAAMLRSNRRAVEAGDLARHAATVLALAERKRMQG